VCEFESIEVQYFDYRDYRADDSDKRSSSMDVISPILYDNISTGVAQNTLTSNLNMCMLMVCS